MNYDSAPFNIIFGTVLICIEYDVWSFGIETDKLFQHNLLFIDSVFSNIKSNGWCGGNWSLNINKIICN